MALSNADAMKLMGACININLLMRKPAAFAHARTYTRRLIYDTIDFLNDQEINMPVSVTAHAIDAVTFIADTAAFTGNVEGPTTTLFGTTTEAMTYLRRYSRSTGAWSTTEPS
jgi:hypothetical protein